MMNREKVGFCSMEKAAIAGGFFKFLCLGDMQAAVTPRPT
jgi:hypothetical protein